MSSRGMRMETGQVEAFKEVHFDAECTGALSMFIKTVHRLSINTTLHEGCRVLNHE